MDIYHGSNVKVEHPEIRKSGFYKDFGYGFYCTKIEHQAQRWALTKRDKHIVSVFDYTPDTQLRIKTFPEMSEEWLDFIVGCRNGNVHDWDIVEGPMADDQIWDYVEDFIQGDITREAFWVLVKFKHPTHQIVFCTENSLRTMKYEKSYAL